MNSPVLVHSRVSLTPVEQKSIIDHQKSIYWKQHREPAVCTLRQKETETGRPIWAWGENTWLAILTLNSPLWHHIELVVLLLAWIKKAMNWLFPCVEKVQWQYRLVAWNCLSILTRTQRERQGGGERECVKVSTVSSESCTWCQLENKRDDERWIFRDDLKMTAGSAVSRPHSNTAPGLYFVRKIKNKGRNRKQQMKVPQLSTSAEWSDFNQEKNLSWKHLQSSNMLHFFQIT